MTGRPIWERGWFWLLLAALSTLPFVVAPMPMMPDHFAHMARYHVMNHGEESAFLPRYYSFSWTLIGNLGVDLLMLPLGRLWPTETAATVAAAIIPMVTVAGIYALARAVHGRVPATALMALGTLYSFSFLFGFENYHLSVGLGLLCAAAWIALKDASAWQHWLLIAPFSLLVWVAHFGGWGAMGLIVLGWELSRFAPGGGWKAWLGQWPKMIWRMLPLASPLALLPLWRSGSGSGEGVRFYGPKVKARHVVEFFRAENIWVDGVLAAVTALVLIWMVWKLWRTRERSMTWAAGLMIFAWLALPNSMLSTFYVDQRLLAVALVLIVLALPEANRRQGRTIAVIALALFGARLAEISIGWTQRGQMMQAELKALDYIPRGSRIASASQGSVCPYYVLHGFDHLANFAIFRNEAFVNTQWDVPGQQLMRPIYNRNHGYNDNNSGRFGMPRGRCYGQPLETLVADLPRDRFDFLWSFDAPIDQPWLKLVFEGAHGRLYRIVTPAAPQAPGGPLSADAG